MEKRSFSGIARVMPSSHTTAGDKAVLAEAISAHLTSFTHEFIMFRCGHCLLTVAQKESYLGVHLNVTFTMTVQNCGVLKFCSGELRVEVDSVPHHHPVSTDSSSSSGYSSSSCSPRTPLCCDSTLDRTRDIHRRECFSTND